MENQSVYDPVYIYYRWGYIRLPSLFPFVPTVIALKIYLPTLHRRRYNKLTFAPQSFRDVIIWYLTV